MVRAVSSKHNRVMASSILHTYPHMKIRLRGAVVSCTVLGIACRPCKAQQYQGLLANEVVRVGEGKAQQYQEKWVWVWGGVRVPIAADVEADLHVGIDPHHSLAPARQRLHGSGCEHLGGHQIPAPATCLARARQNSAAEVVSAAEGGKVSVGCVNRWPCQQEHEEAQP